MKAKIKSQAYTLIEMLVVVAMIALLFGIGLPAFEKLAKGQGASLAARTISGKLKAARAYAISKRVNVAVLFPKYLAAFPTIGYLNASYRAGVVTGGTGTFTWVRWIEGENWEFLPKGAVVLDIDDTSGLDTINQFSNASTVNDVNLSNIGLGTAVDDLRAVVFKPSGKADRSAYIVIDEGVSSGTTVTRTNPASPGLSLYVNEFTGRVSFEED